MPLQCLKGIVWRFTPLAENGEHSIAQSVFDYMTKPYEGAVLFAEGYDLQEQMMNSCYTALLKSALRLQQIDLSIPIVWDNKLFFELEVFLMISTATN